VGPHLSAHRPLRPPTCVPIGRTAANWSDVPLVSLLHIQQTAVLTHSSAAVLLLLHCFRCRVVLSQQRARRVARAATTAGIICVQPFVRQATPSWQFPGPAVSGQDRGVHIGQCVTVRKDRCLPTTRGLHVSAHNVEAMHRR
jgi:hypothetical protein